MGPNIELLQCPVLSDKELLLAGVSNRPKTDKYIQQSSNSYYNIIIHYLETRQLDQPCTSVVKLGIDLLNMARNSVSFVELLIYHKDLVYAWLNILLTQ